MAMGNAKDAANGMRSDELREQGIAALKERRMDEARRLLAEAIKLNPRDAEAWAYLGVMSTDPKARLAAFKRALEIAPDNKTARTSLKALGVDPASLAEMDVKPAPPKRPTQTFKPPTGPLAKPPSEPKRPPHSPSPFSTDDGDMLPGDDGESDELALDDDFDSFDDSSLFDEDTNPETAAALFGVKLPDAPKAPPAPDKPAAPAGKDASAPRPVATGLLRPPKLDQNFSGVPLPQEAYLERAGALAEANLAQAPKPAQFDIQWARKTKNRAGENDVWQLRLQTGAAITAVVLVIGFVLVAFVTSPQAQRLVGIRTNTPSRTPTNTPTVTPGITPTSTATLNPTELAEATPIPPTPPGLTALARIDRTPVPTQLFAANIFSLEGAMPRVIGTLNAGGDAAAVLPTLDAELRLVSLNFNPYPYVYKALALARVGNFETAIETLLAAEERLVSDTRAEQRPFAAALINATYAEIELMRAQSLRRAGRVSLSNQSYAAAIEKAEAALDANAQVPNAYIVLAVAAFDQGRYEDALDVLDLAISPQVNVAAFNNNLDMIGLRGQIYLAQAAGQQGREADRLLAQADTQGRAAFFVNPYDRRGHELQIEVALAQGRAGDAVLLNDTYRLYFPGDPRAFKLLGDARLLEGNPDLAFSAYTDAANAAVANAGGIGPDAADALVARGDLLYGLGEWGAALADYTTAYDAVPDVATRLKRMNAAYAAGEYALANEDAVALVGSGAAPDDVFYLMQARVRYDLASVESPEALFEAAPDILRTLERAGSALPNDLRAVAESYRARVALLLGNLTLAEQSANSAYSLDPTPNNLLVRADVRAALGRFDDARADYRAVLDATADVNEGLALLARNGLEALPARITATAAVTATARAEITATAQANATATAELATATAVQQETATAEAVLSLTPNVTP
jgi:tetratricopeptide (TPR) repeat protein